MSAKNVAMNVLPLLVMVVVEEGDRRCLDVLVKTIGACDADDLVKAGRRVNRRLGVPIFVRALLPEKSGGGQ